MLSNVVLECRIRLSIVTACGSPQHVAHLVVGIRMFRGAELSMKSPKNSLIAAYSEFCGSGVILINPATTNPIQLMISITDLKHYHLLMLRCSRGSQWVDVLYFPPMFCHVAFFPCKDQHLFLDFPSFFKPYVDCYLTLHRYINRETLSFSRFSWPKSCTPKTNIGTFFNS